MNAKENLLRVIRHDSPEWVPDGMESVIQLSPPGVLGLARRRGSSGPDCWGVMWEYENQQVDTYPAHDGWTIRNLADWREEIQVPDIDAEDWSVLPRGWTPTDEAIRPVEIDRDEHLVCGIVEEGLFERACLLLGMENALAAFLTEPEAMDELIGCIADYHVKLIVRFHEAAGLDMVWYGDDWGGQERLLVSPDTWRRLIKPHTRRVYDCMKERGLIINQHSCGRIEEVFADMVEMGADMWNFCQPCNNLAGLKKQFGDLITFCGGIDSQFVLDRPGVSTDEVRAEVRRRIDELAEGGGYIAGPSHGVPYDPEIIGAMKDEIACYGRRFYAQ